MFSKLKTTRVILLLLEAVLLIAVCSCDERQKRETLSFFFDGVPAIDPNLVIVGGEHRKLGNLDDEDQESVSRSWYVHAPSNDCKLCHGERSKKLFTKEVHLVTPIPKLCYDCHAEQVKPTKKIMYAASVHGPVAVGQCLLCHHHHRSRHRGILKEPAPKLCYGCHDRDAIALIVGHGKRLDSVCTKCHEAHASSARMLLKDDWRTAYLDE